MHGRTRTHKLTHIYTHTYTSTVFYVSGIKVVVPVEGKHQLGQIELRRAKFWQTGKIIAN